MQLYAKRTKPKSMYFDHAINVDFCKGRKTVNY